jgi:hypothetical protein
MDSWNTWANDVFGEAQLGDSRRTARLVRMAAQAGRKPGGRISEVFSEDADRQGAYDFIESEHIDAASVRAAIIASTARRCAGKEWVYVPVDGTSLKFWDGTGEKDFGAIGTYRSGATGLKLYNAIALDSAGTPLGVAGQVWWRRPRANPNLRRPSYKRKVPDKETKYLLECIEQVCSQMKEHAPKVRCWFQLDRGCDAQDVLELLNNSGHWFTVRAHSDRKLLSTGKSPQFLKKTMGRQQILGEYDLALPGRVDRPARLARLAIRSATVTLRLRYKWSKRPRLLHLNAVLVRETRAVKGQRVEWLLLTNRPVDTLEQALQVVHGYVQRWRIEEYHKTWKTGTCNTERCQLHSTERVVRWATILSAVAARIERLKFLSRNQPEEPATIELTHDEVGALTLLRERRKKRNEIVPSNPTIGQATLWIAELGGYTGKSSGGPPGTITIARGFEVLEPAVEMFRILKGRQKKR